VYLLTPNQEPVAAFGTNREDGDKVLFLINIVEHPKPISRSESKFPSMPLAVS
jgi:hypothetical protein